MIIRQTVGRGLGEEETCTGKQDITRPEEQSLPGDTGNRQARVGVPESRGQLGTPGGREHWRRGQGGRLGLWISTPCDGGNEG